MKRCLAVAMLGMFLLLGGSGRASAVPPDQGHYEEFADARGFLDIRPPGADGVENANQIALGSNAQQPHTRDQLSMYSDLVYNAPGLTEGALSNFYKDAAFGVPESD